MAAGTGISLVIPARDEAASVQALVGSIRQRVRQPDEVILVDGGSSDGIGDVPRRLIDGDGRYRLIEAGPATPGRGRNLGIEAAAHPWVALTDAGLALDPHWLDRLVRPDRLVTVGAILAVVDAGTILGWLESALVPRRAHPHPRACGRDTEEGS